MHHTLRTVAVADRCSELPSSDLLLLFSDHIVRLAVPSRTCEPYPTKVQGFIFSAGGVWPSYEIKAREGVSRPGGCPSEEMQEICDDKANCLHRPSLV
jgi:hypothetical protein